MDENIVATLAWRNETMTFAATKALYRPDDQWISHGTIRPVKETKRLIINFATSDHVGLSSVVNCQKDRKRMQSPNVTQ